MGFYFFSNDQFNWTPTYQADDAILIGVANHQLLHVIGEALLRGVKFREIVAVDNNAEQLRFLRKLVDIAQKHETVYDYACDVLCINRFNESRIGMAHLTGEEKVWANTRFSQSKFTERYGVPAEFTGQSIRIESPVCGGFSTQHLTFVNSEHHRYAGGYPFPMGFYAGYLHPDIFVEAKHEFQKIRYLNKPIEDELIPSILRYQYAPHIIWASNLFTPFFMDQNPKLRRFLSQLNQMGSQTEPNFPELQLTVLQDHRIPAKLNPLVNGPMRPKSIHTETFRAVARHIPTSELVDEISNQWHWIEQDQGTSKLGGRHIHVEDAITETMAGCIFLHILAGHGYGKEKFENVLRKAHKESDRLIILEHNAESSDFGSLVWVTQDWIRSVLGNERSFEYVCPNDRNFIMVY